MKNVFCFLIAVVMCMTAERETKAEFVFNVLPNSSGYTSDGVNATTGFFDISLAWTGGGTSPDFRSYGVFLNHSNAVANSFNFTSASWISPSDGGISMPSAYFDARATNTGLSSTIKVLNTGDYMGLVGDKLVGRVYFEALPTSIGTYSFSLDSSSSVDDFEVDTTPGVSLGSNSITISAVPEPSTMALLGLIGLGGVAGRKLAKRKRKNADLTPAV